LKSAANSAFSTERKPKKMAIDTWQGQRLDYNDTITYRKAAPAAQNPNAPAQEEGRHTGIIADFTDSRIGVRRDGLHGQEPLYYVRPEDVITVKKRNGSAIASPD
jgi:hypothetical protein